MKQTKVYTMVRLSLDTFTKMHKFKQPFETHDETLNRILTEYREMSNQLNYLQDSFVKTSSRK